MKTNARKTADLNGLLKLVMQWRQTKSRNAKVTLRQRIARVNDRYFARWKHDGVATLLKGAR